MKKLIITLIVAAFVLWNAQSGYGQTSIRQNPTASGISENLYHCPNHPEVTATWPAK